MLASKLGEERAGRERRELWMCTNRLGRGSWRKGGMSLMNHVGTLLQHSIGTSTVRRISELMRELPPNRERKESEFAESDLKLLSLRKRCEGC